MAGKREGWRFEREMDGGGEETLEGERDWELPKRAGTITWYFEGERVCEMK